MGAFEGEGVQRTSSGACCATTPEMPKPGWEDPVGKDQRFGDSIAIASSIKRLCQAKHVTQHVIA